MLAHKSDTRPFLSALQGSQLAVLRVALTWLRDDRDRLRGATERPRSHRATRNVKRLRQPGTRILMRRADLGTALNTWPRGRSGSPGYGAPPRSTLRLTLRWRVQNHQPSDVDRKTCLHALAGTGGRRPARLAFEIASPQDPNEGVLESHLGDGPRPSRNAGMMSLLRAPWSGCARDC